MNELNLKDMIACKTGVTPFLDLCCATLGWQGGTIHQILDVLKAAKFVVDTYERHNYVDDLRLLPKSIASLSAHVNGSRYSR